MYFVILQGKPYLRTPGKPTYTYTRETVIQGTCISFHKGNVYLCTPGNLHLLTPRKSVSAYSRKTYLLTPGKPIFTYFKKTCFSILQGWKHTFSLSRETYFSLPQGNMHFLNLGMHTSSYTRKHTSPPQGKNMCFFL
jgi:hypothetical protein